VIPGRSRSLVARLTLVQMAVLALLWMIVIGASVLDVFRRGEGAVDLELQALASSMARLAPDDASPAEAARIGAEFKAISMEASSPALRNEEIAYQLWSHDGRLLAHSGQDPPLPALPPGAAASTPDVRVPGWHFHGAWSRSRNIYAVVAERDTYYRRRAWNIVEELAALWVALALLSAAACWWSFRVILRPVRALADRVAARSADDLSPVDGADAFVEIKPLIESLNQKLARIHQMLESERQFFADAAHELRTPLSVIGAQAHVLAHESGLSQRLAALRTLEGGIDRSARVISRLLMLGKLDASAGVGSRQSHDVAGIAAAIVSAHQARALAANQHLVMRETGPVTLDCDAGQLAVAIENLIDNALRYGGIGCQVEVSVRAEGGSVIIAVADDGPGIAVADRERVFKRFYRAGTPDSTGSGLGLAIVARIAVLHDGCVRVSDGLSGKGVTMEITL
jgi:two-component system OmpR family sensor kinase